MQATSNLLENFQIFPFRLQAEMRAGIDDDAELAEQIRQQSEALDATKKVTSILTH